jgi:demethylmenaquinone methyltransferase/2-methoxy-6-polyprenyl-1,4-benzoquinol methylase
MPPQEIRAVVDEFAATGDVLELACGTGRFTGELARHARSVTAVDGSPRMLERNRREVGSDKVRYLYADIFELQADRQYDAVFFGFWLSHVPLERFDAFWSFVRSSLRAGGRVGFVDEDDRGIENDHLRLVDGVTVAARTLRDGRQLDVIKQYWNPAALEARLRLLDWAVEVRPVGGTFLYGASV